MAVIDDFRETAVPRLRDVARAQAFFVALDLIDLDEARAEVHAAARKVGSALLSARDQDRLVDWIANVLWAEAEKATDRVAAIQSRAASAEKTDPVRYFDGLAARCATPAAIRWTFAAISTPYRTHLTRERYHARKA